MVTVVSWGRLARAEHAAAPLGDRLQVGAALRAATPGLAYGMGRSYGDACLNPSGTLWLTRGLDRFMHFDAQTGVLECEAGVLLRDIQRMIRITIPSIDKRTGVRPAARPGSISRFIV